MFGNKHFLFVFVFNEKPLHIISLLFSFIINCRYGFFRLPFFEHQHVIVKTHGEFRDDGLCNSLLSNDQQHIFTRKFPQQLPSFINIQAHNRFIKPNFSGFKRRQALFFKLNPFYGVFCNNISFRGPSFN